MPGRSYNDQVTIGAITIYSVTGVPAFAAALGSLAVRDDAAEVYQNTGGSSWSLLAGGSGLPFVATNEWFVDSTAVADATNRIYPSIATALANAITVIPANGLIVLRIRDGQAVHLFDFATDLPTDRNIVVHAFSPGYPQGPTSNDTRVTLLGDIPASTGSGNKQITFTGVEVNMSSVTPITIGDDWTLTFDNCALINVNFIQGDGDGQRTEINVVNCYMSTPFGGGFGVFRAYHTGATDATNHVTRVINSAINHNPANATDYMFSVDGGIIDLIAGTQVQLDIDYAGAVEYEWINVLSDGGTMQLDCAVDAIREQSIVFFSEDGGDPGGLITANFCQAQFCVRTAPSGLESGSDVTIGALDDDDTKGSLLLTTNSPPTDYHPSVRYVESASGLDGIHIGQPGNTPSNLQPQSNLTNFTLSRSIPSNTGATPIALLPDAASLSQLGVVVADPFAGAIQVTVAFSALISVSESGGTTDTAAFKVEGLMKRLGGVFTLVAQTVTVLHDDSGGDWDVRAAVDTGTNQLRIEGTTNDFGAGGAGAAAFFGGYLTLAPTFRPF